MFALAIYWLIDWLIIHAVRKFQVIDQASKPINYYPTQSRDSCWRDGIPNQINPLGIKVGYDHQLSQPFICVGLTTQEPIKQVRIAIFSYLCLYVFLEQVTRYVANIMI